MLEEQNDKKGDKCKSWSRKLFRALKKCPFMWSAGARLKKESDQALFTVDEKNIFELASRILICKVSLKTC
jgi:hypothetical protein